MPDGSENPKKKKAAPKAPRPKGTKKQKTEDDKEPGEIGGKSTKATLNMDGNEEQKDSAPPTKAPKKRRVVKKPEEGQTKLSFGGAAE